MEAPARARVGLRDRLTRIDLGLAALAAATAELALDRVLPAVRSERLPGALELLAVFSRHLAGVLGVVVLAYAIGLTVGRRDLFGAPARALFAVLGIVLAPLLGWAAVAPMPAWLATHVESSFLFLALACIYAATRSGMESRTKAGLAVLALPILARGYALAAGSLEALALGRLDTRQLVEHMGEAAALIAAVAAPLLLPPRALAPRLPRRGPLILAALVTLGFVLLASFRFSFLESAVGALGFALPEEVGGRLIYYAGLFGTTWTVAALLPAGGQGRLVATGLCLLAVSGYSLSRPSELAATGLGLLCILWGEVGAGGLGARARAAPVDAERWLTEARRVATEMGGECVLVNDDDRVITRLSGQRAGHAVVLRVVREGGEDAVEVVVGEPPSAGNGAIEIAERAGATEALSFERRYRVHVSDGVAPPTEGIRQAVAPLGGTTAFWPTRGIKWQRTFASPAPLAWLSTVAERLAGLL